MGLNPVRSPSALSGIVHTCPRFSYLLMHLGSLSPRPGFYFRVGAPLPFGGGGLDGFGWIPLFLSVPPPSWVRPKAGKMFKSPFFIPWDTPIWGKGAREPG